MTPVLDFDGNPFSNITIQAMADMGYEVDSSQAEAYRVPRQAAKVVAAPPGSPWATPVRPALGLRRIRLHQAE